MPESVVTINLEIGHPTVEEARQMLKAGLEQCRNRKVIAVKVIHGYGSSGVGGALRHGIRKSLINRRKEGSLRAVVFGENWSIFDSVARSMLEQCPVLSKDRDLGNSNPGISVVLL
jgi:ribosomal protein S9